MPSYRPLGTKMAIFSFIFFLLWVARRQTKIVFPDSDTDKNSVTGMSDRRIVTSVAHTGNSMFLCDPEMKKRRKKEQLT